MENNKVAGLFATEVQGANEEDIKQLRKATRLANATIPFIVKNGQMTSMGADLRISYYDRPSAPFVVDGAPQRHQRHQMTVELRIIGGLVPTTPIGDLEPCPIGLEGLCVFAEACIFRVVVDGLCRCFLLWGLGAGRATHSEGPWEAELLKAVNCARKVA